MGDKKAGTIMQMVRFKTRLSEEQLLKVAKEREPHFKAISGILQKYYLKLGDHEYGGVYVWDSIESLETYRASDLAASIPYAYQVIEPPTIEVMDILFELRA
ncbi:hypothetical protein [Aestuariivivens sp. NBU2969]|uniref:hypothetical protein n=1 Tax=Aestuariivivens sp. NBU2969 TaxID=2873267 RepID=UPI001CBE281D|nr:hypothetical protein [Aestuariivivens sp. NBU2969]